MSISKTLLFLSLGSLFAIVILQVSFSSLVVAKQTTGCTALSDTGDLVPSDTIAFWDNHTVNPLIASLDDPFTKQPKVLGTSYGDKWIEIDLSEQRLTAWEGDQIFLESLISSGLWNKTPPGEYNIWYKVKYTKMEGGIKGQRSYYYLPNVPFSMFFFGDYGIHGTYWHNNFGQPMSHGCVNTPTSIAEKIFYWSSPQLPENKNSIRASQDNPGTRVVIHE